MSSTSNEKPTPAVGGEAGGISEQQEQGRGKGSVPDCTGCKVVGAGGCFAGALYALHLRSKFPSSEKKFRFWLGALGLGVCVYVCECGIILKGNAPFFPSQSSVQRSSFLKCISSFLLTFKCNSNSSPSVSHRPQATWGYFAPLHHQH